MGICGRYIDAHEAMRKDRVIEAQGWITGGFYDSYGNRCLVGHAEAWSGEQRLNGLRSDDVCGPNGDLLRGEMNRRGYYVFEQFDRLCARFGKDRIVRACKMRAAKGNQELVEKIREGAFVSREEESHV